ncbi:hypothetical protein [Methylotenera sp. G11]|uniref:hypothetical protein n=1 Tax=Methylotenera sp. G11 TaxID=1506585 RepID=UPI000645707F|nr:hypothetical protein [Methylotenera sp. G11]
MSKINPVQAAALKDPVEKTASEKTVPEKKAAPTKAVATKPATVKAPVAKTAAAKPVAKAAVKPAPGGEALKTAAPKKAEKPAKEKTPKLKMERDSFTMPKTEYAQFHVLKERLNTLGQPAKKSELLRAGIMQLSAMTDAALKAALAKVPAIKTGRPKKK